MKSEFTSLKQFYNYYLSQHRDGRCRLLHYLGCLSVLFIIIFVVFTALYWWLLLAPIAGYGFAWAGHIFFEKNRPATFSHPIYSFLSDWLMFRDIITGKLAI